MLLGSDRECNFGTRLGRTACDVGGGMQDAFAYDASRTYIVRVDATRRQSSSTLGWPREGRRFDDLWRAQTGQTASRARSAMAVPKGPRGEQRPAHALECAAAAPLVATGEIKDTRLRYPARRRGNLAGARARAESMTLDERRDNAVLASRTRWNAKEEAAQCRTLVRPR